MKPVLERTPVTAQCPGGHTWETVILPGSTMPQTPSCPQCDMLVSFYPSLRARYCECGRLRADCVGGFAKNRNTLHADRDIPLSLVEAETKQALWDKQRKTNRKARENRRARREVLESTGLRCYRVNGREVWE